MIAELTEAGASRDHCPRFPAEKDGEGHAIVSDSPAGTSIFVRHCSWCDWIDGEDLEAQVVARGVTLDH